MLTRVRAGVDEIARAPKVLLHDHLDGGLRPQTMIELAAGIGHELPTTDPDELARWFQASADSGSLERYLETFAHTVALMQTREALIRIATECVEDLASDGVVYAEVRYAPEQHLNMGMSLIEVVEAVEEGFRIGERRAAEAGRLIRVRTLLTAMRHAANSKQIADLVISTRDDSGVVGFDIAGAEAGFPPSRHADAFQQLRRENAHFTIHAGEAVGLPSIWEAVQCGADRLGHGVRIVDDIEVDSEGTVRLGRLAAYLRDKRIPLEMCPSSNVQTGAANAIADHPIGLLTRLRFRVTVNTDNRLMSGTSMSRELTLLSDAFGFDLDDLCWFTVNALKSAFIPFDERLALINGVVNPGYALLAAERAAAQVQTAPSAR